MLNFTNGLKAKLLTVKNAVEVAEIVKTEGQDISAEEAENLFQEITRFKDGSELSVEELESVSGGADRDWLTDGCAATVEAGSWCGSNDFCHWWDVTYEHNPQRLRCACGTNYYALEKKDAYTIYKCPKCGDTERVDNEVNASY